MSALGPDSIPARRGPQERHALTEPNSHTNPNPNPNQERHALTELLHSMLVLEPEKRCSAASALLSLSPLYSRAVGETV